MGLRLSLWRGVGRLAMLAIVLALAGCGGKFYPVRGKVTFDDGKPLTAGMVIFEKKDGEALTARGEIQPDGHYELSTKRPGDGAPAGHYRVHLSFPVDIGADNPSDQLPFEPRFADPKNSGLEFEVKAETNDIPIEVKRRRR